MGSEGCVAAAMLACRELKERLEAVKAFFVEEEGREPEWAELIKTARSDFFPNRLVEHLSATANYKIKGRNNIDTIRFFKQLIAGKAPPEMTGVQFGPSHPDFLEPGSQDPDPEKGDPLRGLNLLGHGLVDYFAFSGGVSEVEIDVLTGHKTVIRSDIVQDTGKSLNPMIDIGQTEGAFVYGMGYYFQEEVIMDPETGATKTNDTWEYKPMLNGDIPIEFNVELWNDKENPNPDKNAVRGSKATGEPPVLASATVYTALKAAIRASRVERGLSPDFELAIPATVDRVQAALELSVADMTL